MIKEIILETSNRNQLIDVTLKIQKIISENKIFEGICIVFVPHTTAGITIQENADFNVVSDFLSQLSKIIPENSNFKHSEGNSDAHIKASLVGNSVVVPIQNSKLLLGTWQAIFFCEFDGPRKRKIIIQIISK